MTQPDHIDGALSELIGTLDDPMPLIDQRIRGRFGDDAIVWEGEASTFQAGVNTMNFEVKGDAETGPSEDKFGMTRRAAAPPKR